MARKKIPVTIDAEIMFLSDLKCCIDNNKGDHIHHLDGNNSNNSLDNLVLLCFDCHNQASIKGNLSKKLSVPVIKKYRAHHYQVIKTQRDNALKTISGKQIKQFTQEGIIEATTISIVLIEVAKIQEEYYQSVKMDRNEILRKLFSYKTLSSPRVLVSILDFLTRVAYETRGGLPSEMIGSIKKIIISYFLLLNPKTNDQQLFELGKFALNIGRTIVYDTSIHSKDYYSMTIGYAIIKFIYNGSPTFKNKKLKAAVIDTFNELKEQLKRPERNDLQLAEQMRQIYLDDLKTGNLTEPEFPKELSKQIMNSE